MEAQKVGDIDVTPKVCGHCGTKTVFMILAIDIKRIEEETYGTVEIKTFRLLKCQTCSEPTLEEEIFYSEDAVYPDYMPTVRTYYPIVTKAPPPTKDMPRDIADIYNEARIVLPYSPKSSAALLRLAIQQLCEHLGKSGKNLNNNISDLVKDGLSTEVQQALDSVRVIGNNAVQPGSIDFNDNPALVETLFKLVNFIVEEMITRPREIKEIYDSLPQSQLEQIERRGKKAKAVNP